MNTENDGFLEGPVYHPLNTNYILTQGAIAGMIWVVLTTILYAMGIEYFTGGWTFVAMLGSYGFVVYAVIKERNALGGFMEYRDAFLRLFLISLVVSFISIVFTAVLYTVVDPELNDKVFEAVSAKTIEMTERFGGEDAAEKVAESLEASRADMEMTPYNLAKNFLTGSIFGAILWAIVAFFVRKKRPEVV